VGPTKEDIIAALKTVYDPEIPVNIWDLGLVYDIQSAVCSLQSADSDRNKNNNLSAQLTQQLQTANCKLQTVKIKMTMTSPTCPMSEEIMQAAHAAVSAIPGIGSVDIELVWDPPWDVSRMSDTARLELDLTERGW